MIVATASEILDSGGRNALSMRTIAGRLEVKAAPLYNLGDSSSELHARTYSQTIIVLPRIGDRPGPTSNT